MWTDAFFIPREFFGLEGWLYLAVIIDRFSRRVVGWSLSEWLERGIVLDALKMALQYRHPPQGLLHHSDRGSRTPATNISSCWRYTAYKAA